MLPVISLIGILASGKRSIGAMLADQFSLCHLVVADLLDDVVNPRSNGRKTVKQYIYEHVVDGGIIPTDLCAELEPFMHKTVEAVMDDFYDRGQPTPPGILLPALYKRIKSVSMEGKYRAILLDGFPRRLDDLAGAQQVFGKVMPDLTIWIDCPEEVARSRYSGRIPAGFKRNVAYFNEHMPLVLPELERTGLVWSVSDDSMSVEEAYINLLTLLFPNETWNRIVNT